jgi:hypothetical protein
MCQENILSLSISGHLRYFHTVPVPIRGSTVLRYRTAPYTHVVVTHVLEVDTRVPVPVLPICILHSRTVRIVRYQSIMFIFNLSVWSTGLKMPRC